MSVFWRHVSSNSNKNNKIKNIPGNKKGAAGDAAPNTTKGGWRNIR
jgi:hypothetical protein